MRPDLVRANGFLPNQLLYVFVFLQDSNRPAEKEADLRKPLFVKNPPQPFKSQMKASLLMTHAEYVDSLPQRVSLVEELGERESNYEMLGLSIDQEGATYCLPREDAERKRANSAHSICSGRLVPTQAQVSSLKPVLKKQVG